LPEHYREMTLLDDPFGGECMNMYKAGLMNAHRWVALTLAATLTLAPKP